MRFIVWCSALVIAINGHTAFGYPTKPIRLIVPFPAGESIDVTARLISQSWQAELGQQIVVDNRGGAGGTISLQGRRAGAAGDRGGQAAPRVQHDPGVPAHVRAGRLKAYVITARNRSPLLPDVPACTEVGLPGIEASAWHAVVAPAGTPKEIVSKLQQTLAKTLVLPEVRTRLADSGAEPVGSTPEAFAKFLRAESDKWARVIKTAGVKAE